MASDEEVAALAVVLVRRFRCLGILGFGVVPRWVRRAGDVGMRDGGAAVFRSRGEARPSDVREGGRGRVKGVPGEL